MKKLTKKRLPMVARAAQIVSGNTRQHSETSNIGDWGGCEEIATHLIDFDAVDFDAVCRNSKKFLGARWERVFDTAQGIKRPYGAYQNCDARLLTRAEKILADFGLSF